MNGVAASQALKARNIPAWGNAPGKRARRKPFLSAEGWSEGAAVTTELLSSDHAQVPEGRKELRR